MNSKIRVSVAVVLVCTMLLCLAGCGPDEETQAKLDLYDKYEKYIDMLEDEDYEGLKKEVNELLRGDGPDMEGIYNEHCSGKSWAELGSDGSYLSIDTNPFDIEDKMDYDALDAIEAVNAAFGLPESLYNDMLETTWSMGKQSETFDSIGITVTWTYHPDKGMEVSYKLINN